MEALVADRASHFEVEGAKTAAGSSPSASAHERCATRTRLRAAAARARPARGDARREACRTAVQVRTPVRRANRLRALTHRCVAALVAMAASLRTSTRVQARLMRLRRLDRREQDPASSKRLQRNETERHSAMRKTRAAQSGRGGKAQPAVAHRACSHRLFKRHRLRQGLPCAASPLARAAMGRSPCPRAEMHGRMSDGPARAPAAQRLRGDAPAD